MKIFFTSFFLLCTLLCLAQRQNVYLLKNNGERVTNQDSADFIRIVREPEKGEVLYGLLDYYINGKQKLIGKTSTVEPVKFEGAFLTFFKNGQRKSIATYRAGRLINDVYEFFPNGKIYVVKKYPSIVKYEKGSDTDFIITDAYDSLGVAKVTDRKGYYTGYNEEFTEVAEEGPIENGKRTGDWKGADKKDTVTFVEKYADGILVEGAAIKNGKTYNYTKARLVKPEFPNGDQAFAMFLARAVRYPAAARENKIQGVVVLKFFVEKDGALSNIRIVHSVESSLDAEALHALRGATKWIPGTKFGLPVKVEYTVPIKFALSNE